MPQRARWIVPILLTGQFMANLDFAISNVATPAIGSTLHASGAELQLVVSVYALASAMLFVTAAHLGDRFGLGPVFSTGTAIFTLASAWCALAPTAAALVAARLVQGVGAALFAAQVIAGIGRATAPGPERASWRPIFAVNVPIGIVLFAAAAIALPRERRPGSDLDPVGVALFATATLALIAPLTFGRELDWPSWTWMTLAASLGAFIAFGAWERARSATRVPLIDLALLATPRIAWNLMARMCTLITYLSLLFVIARYLQDGLAQSALVSGAVVVAWVAAYGLAGIVYARVPQHLVPWCGPTGALLMAIVFGAMCAWTEVGGRLDAELVLLLAAGGVSWGICSTAIVSQLAGAAAQQHASAMSGLLATLGPLTAAVGVATFGGAYLSLAAAGDAPRAFAFVCGGFAVSAAVAAAAAIRALPAPQPAA